MPFEFVFSGMPQLDDPPSEGLQLEPEELDDAEHDAEH